MTFGRFGGKSGRDKATDLALTRYRLVEGPLPLCLPFGSSAHTHTHKCPLAAFIGISGNERDVSIIYFLDKGV